MQQEDILTLLLKTAGSNTYRVAVTNIAAVTYTMLLTNNNSSNTYSSSNITNINYNSSSNTCIVACIYIAIVTYL